MALPENFMTPEDYLKFERASETKHEYLAGEIFAMSGVSRSHDRIVNSISSYLYAQLLEGPCESFSSDMRVKVHSSVYYTYPDLSVVCGEQEFEDSAVDTLLNPTIVIEVLSPSTERYDRGKKFNHYKTVSSLQEYILIAQDSPQVERFVRRPDGEWTFTVLVGLEAVLELPLIQCRLPLEKIYERVNFDIPEA
jgi:Uma2 family endonuclease